LTHVEGLISELGAKALAALAETPIEDHEVRTALSELVEIATRREV
jgi:hypothetical protein